MASPASAFLVAALTVGIAAVIGYGIFRLLSPRGRAETPTQMGRKWFAWLALITTVTLLPKFIRTFDVNPFAIWALNFIVLGGLAFIGGWLYAKAIGLKTPLTARQSNAPTQPAAPSQSPELSTMSNEFPSSAPTAETSSKSSLPMSNIEEEYWAKALAEYEGASRRPGLWARVFSEAQGNEAIAKANYLKHRASELFYEHQQQLLAQAQAEREAIERSRLAKRSEEERAYELLSKGKCPNCDAVIPLASPQCPKCRALFTSDGWKVIPIE